MAKEFVIQKVDPPTWTQSSQNSISLGKEDLGLLAGEPIPKASLKEGGEIVHSDVITHMLTNPDQISLESDSFLFDPLHAKTLMVTSLVESFLASNGNVRLAIIIEEIQPNQSRIYAPGMNEDNSSRDDVRSTVQNNVGKADKIDATVERSSTDEWNTSSSHIE